MLGMLSERVRAAGVAAVRARDARYEEYGLSRGVSLGLDVGG
jgi:hypothetical protein